MAKTKTPMAMQVKRSVREAKQQQKKNKTRRTVDIVRPWTAPQFLELTKEERDIVLDRLQKEVADVPATRSHAVRGVNQVARAVARGELQVVVFATNPESLAFGHLPLLCRLHRVPICMLHLSSKTFGRLFQLKSLVAVGMRAPKTSNSDEAGVVEVSNADLETAGADSTVATNPLQLTDIEQTKIESITEFLISKASKRA